MDNKLTTFQRLNQVLGGSRPKTNTLQSQQFDIGKGELLRTTSPQEYATKKLEIQQDKFLKQQWHRVEGETYQRAMHSEITRLGSYADFENMEFFPEIAAAIDIYTDEACTMHDGKILNIYSSSSRIRNELETLFIDNLKIHTNLPMWIRNVCKYGENFIFLNIRTGEGVIEAKQLPNYEMERKEMDFLDSFRQDGKDSETTFQWRGKEFIFKNWQIAHFRLLGDDRKLPYGTSILEKCRRIYKQLILAEDAMLVYRVTRAPERRVYKVYVGNLDDADIPAYVNDIANRFKRSPLIDPQTGQIDLRYNQAANDQDFFIPMRDENAPSPIETLPGASNLSEIEDIEYLQKKLCIALRVPRTFLGFDDSVGEGKNLSLMDIRFSRSVNRVQQAIIQELNKIAIIHLHMLGFDDDLGNFTLSLNNPSSAAKMLEIDELQVKTTLFKDLVSDAGDGFKVMSRTRASKKIFNMSEEDIKQDLLEQRMEKAAAAEMENTANVIKHTGLFDNVDKMYGDIEVAKKGGGQAPDSESSGGGGGSGGFGGGMGDSSLDFGDEEEEVDAENLDTELGGEEGENTEDNSLSDEDVNDLGSDDELQEMLRKKKSLIKEDLIRRKEKYSKIYFDKLIDGLTESTNKSDDHQRMLDERELKVSKDLLDIMNKIDEKLI